MRRAFRTTFGFFLTAGGAAGGAGEAVRARAAYAAVDLPPDRVAAGVARAAARRALGHPRRGTLAAVEALHLRKFKGGGERRNNII